MKAFFRGDRIWPGGGPYPHILVLLGRYPELRGFARTHLRVLDRYREHLGIVPEDWLHSTVQGFYRPASAQRMQQFADTIRNELRDMEPFTVQFGPSYVGSSGVLVAMYPEADMSRLNRHVLAAAANAGFEIPPAGHRFCPHAALAYGTTMQWDSDSLARDLACLRPERVEITVDRVHLVSQRQNPDHSAGYYTWKVVEELTFSRAAPSRPPGGTGPQGHVSVASTPEPERADHSPGRARRAP